MVVAGNKMDLPEAEQAAQRLEEKTGLPVLRISAVTGAGMDELKKEMFNLQESVSKKMKEKGEINE
jgi:50S ribosomal subunit-associated GTPase HflX